MNNYKDSGVDIENADNFVEVISKIAKKTHNIKVLNSIGSFNALYELPKYKNPVLVSCTDGVGTKIKVAREYGGDEVLGQDLVAMCSNDLATSGAKPLFFLDYFSVGKLDKERDEIIIKSIADACKTINCALVGGETAEMNTKNEYDYDLAGFIVGIQEKNWVVDGSNIRRDNVIIGIESNGVHANGFSLIRKLGIEKFKFYELLKPTHLYNNVINTIVDKVPVNGMAHITGGGIYNNIRRVVPKSMNIYLNWKWKIPSIFNFIQSYGISDNEMKKVFNMGIGYVLILEPKYTDIILKIINDNNFKGYLIGDIY